MNYTIKEFPDDIWKKFKAKCALEGVTIKDKLLQLIKEFISKK